MSERADIAGETGRGGAGEVFLAFLRLGFTSFGGPVAHLGYFREAFVARRRWISDAAYADLVALAHFLPGPSSSQVGLAIGLTRAGVPGALAAWTAFTLPSAILMAAVAYGVLSVGVGDAPAWLHALKLVAVAVVAQAVWGMAKTLTPDAPRILMAMGAAALVLAWPVGWAQLVAISAGALIGLAILRPAVSRDASLPPTTVSRSVAVAALLLFALLLAGLPLLASLTDVQWLDTSDAFYRAGSLVFGGGHVVLPLLDELVVTPGWVSEDVFLAGYGAAQAVPGPLFTFAAYLGTVLTPEPNGIAGAALAIVMIFLPSLLLVVGVLPFWDALRHRALVRRALAGVNAAVVGLLLAALYDPVARSAIGNWADGAWVALALVALMVVRVPAFVVVLGAAAAGAAIDLLW
ncbi:MAG: chromate efflux transporter [Bauldia sp.]|nr:chromate efflux transporter [Bauldia sp.]